MWRYKHYRNAFLIAAVSACLPAAIIGIFVYLIGTANIEAEAKRTHQNQVSYAAERIDSNLSHLETVLSQWSFNLNLSNTYGNLDVEKDFYNIQQVIFKSLTWIKSSDPLIEDVSLYLDKQEVLINENKGILKFQSPAVLQAYRNLVMYQRDIFWTDTISQNSNAAPYMLVVRLPGGLAKTEAALVVEVNAKQLNRLIGELETGDGGSSLLMQQDGRTISLGGHPLTTPSELDQFVTSIVREQGAEQGALLQDWYGRTYSVSFYPMKRIGHIWTLATAAPLEQMTEPVKQLSRVIIYTGLTGLLLALLLSWFASRKLYQPIRKLVLLFKSGRSGPDATDDLDYIANEWKHLSRESKVLQEKLDAQLPALQENFLLQLVQGHLYFLSEDELIERMSQYGWSMRGKLYGVILLQLHGLYHTEGKFAPNDEQLLTFAASNIVEDILKGRGLEAEVINFQDLTVGLLLCSPLELPKEEYRAGRYHLAEELAATLHNLLKVHTTVCIGKSTGSLRAIPELFDDTRKALRRKKLSEPQQILDMEEMMPEGQHRITYPFELEKSVIQSLRMGLEPELYQGLDAFLEVLRKQGDTEAQIRQGLLQLYGNIQSGIMLSGYDPLQLGGGEMLWEELVAIQDPAAVLQTIKQKVIAPYLQAFHATQDVQLKQLVENVLQTIHESYMKDISLDYCADLHGTYAKKLSLGFKQVTGSTFIDYLTRYRLDQAKLLLTETDEKINDIACQVGYQPAYFNRTFKKNEGVTPGQYREQHTPSASS
ncbi:helix-turn-helix domain-containing protein [Paenibacillus sp. TAB 01]|uniref:helix-turn-helix domain-containing protein n=1 Tax=Paenibacillus sp. TAB 01 TaxID=3368988 RepID=UPI00375293E8